MDKIKRELIRCNVDPSQEVPQNIQIETFFNLLNFNLNLILKFIYPKIKMHDGKIYYESDLRAHINGMTYRMARKMCPDRKIRTKITDEDILTLRNTHAVETGAIGAHAATGAIFGSHNIWTGSVRLNNFENYRNNTMVN